MPLYELSIEGPLVREAEKVVSLEGRGYPTLVMRWDSRLFDQPWVTTIVLDYLIALPPLIIGQSTFNEVKIAAFVGGTPTKFLYFGTEMTSSVPRVAPEMENSIAPAKAYQEFRLDEQTCPLPYLKLIQATPRIFGNGPQDYYSPPIKVERYDGTVSSVEHMADFFPSEVANLDAIKGSVLTDPSLGFWNGNRYVGATKIAILRQGKVVGLHARVGRADKDPLPHEIKRRDPKLDVVSEWVAIDVGAATTVIALRGERSQVEFIRLGEVGPVQQSSDYETPTEIAFDHLGRTTKAWRDRVVMPHTRWGDVVVGHAARAHRQRPGNDQCQRAAATLTGLPLLREHIETKAAEPYRFRGVSDPDTSEVLKKPAPPIIDEDGIGSHDPFDPIELYAYYLGLTVNHRLRGIHLKYSVTMPTGWSAERRQSVLVAFRRGIFRSLPAGMVEYHDLERFQVEDVGPGTVPFSVHAFRTFNIQPKNDQIVFATIDAGASETGMLFGILRQARPEERGDGYDRFIEFLEPKCIPWLGGERLLHRLAYRVYRAHEAAMTEASIPFERPMEEPEEAISLLSQSPEARANVVVLKDVLRPLLEQAAAQTKLLPLVRLLSNAGETRDVRLEIDRGSVSETLEAWMAEGIELFTGALTEALTKIGRDPDPYDGLRVILGGRLGLFPFFGEELVRKLPAKVQVHRFKEPEKNNLITPTVKTSCALGVLGMKFDRIGARQRAEKRDAFRYRVGRNRHGQLTDVLDPTVEYDLWREMGAAAKPDIEVLFMPAQDDGDVAADDPRVQRCVCALGPSSVGQRLYLRAVGPARVEISAGPPGGEPSKGGPVWAVDLKAGLAEKVL